MFEKLYVKSGLSGGFLIASPNEDNTLVTKSHELDLTEGNFRYFGYFRSWTRVSRYLAFTSDVGEALRPVVDNRVVNFGYAVSIGYCIADVGWEAYKLHKRNYITEKLEPMSLTQCVVERGMFQLIASIIIPSVFIHSVVDASKTAFKRIGKFQIIGPSVVGLCCIPLLPMYLDHPVEAAIEWGFHNFGPWSKKVHKE